MQPLFCSLDATSLVRGFPAVVWGEGRGSGGGARFAEPPQDPMHQCGGRPPSEAA